MKSHEKRIVTVMVILTISLALLLSICRKIAKEPKYDYSKMEVIGKEKYKLDYNQVMDVDKEGFLYYLIYKNGNKGIVKRKVTIDEFYLNTQVKESEK